MTFTDDLDAVRERAGIRRPARFCIKRFPLGSSTDPVWPWRVTDAERPYVFGRARTHAAALLLVDAILDGHTTVVDDDGEVVAYRPGPADEAFRPTMLDGYLEQLRGYSRAIAREYNAALDAALLPGGNIPCSVLPALEVPEPPRVCTCWRLVRDPDAPYGVRHAAGCALA